MADNTKLAADWSLETGKFHGSPYLVSLNAKDPRRTATTSIHNATQSINPRTQRSEGVQSFHMGPGCKVTGGVPSFGQVEAEEELLTSTLEKRLKQASQEQELVVGKLQKQLEQLNSEKAKLYSEKISLENHLEAEQEFIMNKLHIQVDRARQEKKTLADEKAELAKHVDELAAATEKLKHDKVVLEQEMEAEEELITNRLQRQVDALLVHIKQVEVRLQARGISLGDLGVAPLPVDIPGIGGRINRLSSSMSGGSNSIPHASVSGRTSIPLMGAPAGRYFAGGSPGHTAHGSMLPPTQPPGQLGSSPGTGSVPKSHLVDL